MDSCHIFNFLFGTKKATTELSKCFNNLTGQRKFRTRNVAKNDNTSSKVSGGKQNESASSQSCELTEEPHQPPLSPFKQLQAKLIGLAPGFSNSNSSNTKLEQLNQNKQIESKQLSVTCDAESGTYRARLVELVDEEIDDNNNNYNDINNNNNNNEQIKNRIYSTNIIDNPLLDDIDKLKTSLPKNYNDHDHLNTNEDKSEESCIGKNNYDQSATTIIHIENNNKNQAQNISKRLIMYCDDDFERDKQKFVASSAEVYKLVSESGQSRAKLRRVSSISIDGETCNHIDDDDNNNNNKVEKSDGNIELDCQLNKNSRNDKRSIYVRNVVKSIESNGKFDEINYDKNAIQQQHGYKKPITYVKPMPPPIPPKPILTSISNKSSKLSTKNSQFINFQMNLNKPIKIQELFQNEEFLTKFFFNKLEPLDRCVAAQVCRQWRNILYANQDYWKDLINVIDCTQLRREHLVECIMITLHSAKLKQQQQQKLPIKMDDKSINNNNNSLDGQNKQCSIDSYFDFDQDDIWKIQELCNKFTTNHHKAHSQSYRQQMINSDSNEQTNCNNNNNNAINNCMTASKSSSIPSQISSTLSSISISSLLSPLSESSRIDSIKEKIYNSLDNRGFDALCLFGATDDDIEDIVYKIPQSAHKRITVCRLNNCSLTDRGVELLITTFNDIEELELTGCNEITNAIELKPLINLKKLIITDCINIADGVAQNLLQVANQLNELTLQAYHLTDTFLEYLSLNSDLSRLTKLELPNCKEITNQSLVTMAKHFPQLEILSISGSTKISDDGIEILAEQVRGLKSLDLSWCTRITDASLECIACDLGDTLSDLILDRNVHITDIGIGYLSTMSRLTLLHIRWCPRITDIGLESILGLRTLRYLSLAGIHQITARSLLCLVETDLLEIELTNCPAVNSDLVLFLSAQLPQCNIIF